MIHKSTWLLLAAVIAVGLYLLLIDRRAPSTDDRERHAATLLVFNPEQIQRLAIATDGLTVECERQRSGWFIVNPIHARADPAQVDRFIFGLEALPLVETVTEAQMRSHGQTLADYRLDRPRVRITIEERGRPRIELRVGTNAPVGGTLYVQRNASPAVMVTSTNLLTSLPTSLQSFRDRRFLYRDLRQVQRIDLQWSEGYVQLARRQGAWMMQQPVAAPADAGKVEQLVTALAGLAIVDFVADAQPDPLAYRLSVDDAAAQAALWWEGDEIGLRMFFGKETPATNGIIYARRGDGDSVYTVSRSILDNWPPKPMDLRDRRVLRIDPQDVIALRIRQGETRTTLERRRGDAWGITEPARSPADTEFVNRLIANIAGLTAVRFIEPAQTNLALFGLQPPVVEIEIDSVPPAVSVAQGSVAAPAEPVKTRLWIGRFDETGANVYGMLASDRLGFTFPAASLRTADAGVDWLVVPVNWLRYRERLVLNIDPDRVRRMTRIAAGAPETAAERSSEKGWKAVAPGDGAVDEKALSDILAALSSLKAVRIVSDAPTPDNRYGFETPALRLTVGLSGEGAIVKTLLLGARAEQDGVYAMLQGHDLVFILSDDVAVRIGRPFVK